MAWPVRRLQVMPLHRQQSWCPCCHDARRFAGSTVMSALKESSAALSAGMQLPLDLPSTTEKVAVVEAARMARKSKLDAAIALLL